MPGLWYHVPMRTISPRLVSLFLASMALSCTHKQEKSAEASQLTEPANALFDAAPETPVAQPTVRVWRVQGIPMTTIRQAPEPAAVAPTDEVYAWTDLPADQAPALNDPTQNPTGVPNQDNLLDPTQDPNAIPLEVEPLPSAAGKPTLSIENLNAAENAAPLSLAEMEANSAAKGEATESSPSPESPTPVVPQTTPEVKTPAAPAPTAPVAPEKKPESKN